MARSSGAAPGAARSRAVFQAFPGPGDPGRNIPRGRGTSMPEKFPKALEIAILVTFIFLNTKKRECLERSKIQKRHCSIIPFISCRSTQSSREGGPGERLIEGKGFPLGDEKVLELDSGTGDPISCVYLMPPNGTL